MRQKETRNKSKEKTLVEILVSRQQAEEMREAIDQLEIFEAEQNKIDFDNNIQIALTWWKGIKPTVPNSRTEALGIVNLIKGLQITETDNFRLHILRQKLDKALEKLQEVKRNE